MDANEARVREVWERVHRCDGSYRGYPAGPILVQDVNGHWFDFSDWSAAAAYTETVLEDLRRLREAIDELWKLPKRAWVQYTIARLEAIYAAHIRGIKPDALATAPEGEKI